MILTKRRKEIMELIINGATNSEVGYELDITEQTVKNTVHQIFLKLGAKNRASAVAIWLRKYNGGEGNGKTNNPC